MKQDVSINSETNSFIQSSEFNRFGLITVVILIIGCMGGIAVGMGAIDYVASLAAIVFPTMITLSLVLSVSPMKWILTGTAICVVIDLIIILYFLIA